MKPNRAIVQILFASGFLCSSAPLIAQITFSSSELVSSGNVVPDPPVAGLARMLTVSTPATSITDLSITLDLGSAPGDMAWNGDLYAQITSPGGTLAVLLNRSGVVTASDTGYSDKGYTVTLTDSAPGNVHQYQTLSFALNGSGQLTGSWSSDGRSDVTGSTRDKPLNALLGEDPNGVWTLFVADLATGNQAQLNSWSVSGTAVPEPGMGSTFIGISLALFGWLVRRGPSRGKGNDAPKGH